MSDVLVLCYHAVSPEWDAQLSVTPAALEEQLGLLLDRGWRGATFTQAILKPPHPRTLAVTFDDALVSVRERAQPVLDRLGLPGTIFVPTAYPDGGRPMQWPGIEQWTATRFEAELTPLGWDELAELAAAGWEIGSHTHTHGRLPTLGDAELAEELRRSKRECEERLGLPCDSIAYPYGACDGRVIRATSAAGYLCGAWLSSSLRRTSLHRWPRIGVYHLDDRRRFGLKVNPAMRALRATALWPAHE
jgi:peptidoglycan/xylan/chitin deacetylase (PgdA/CDA1 family)